jgi:2-haloacid dehalogenase
VKLTDFGALSFDCYGTLVDWETGILAALRSWAGASGLRVADGELLRAYAEQESRAQAEHPAELYPRILARTFRGLATALGAQVSDADAERFGRSVPDWPPFSDSHDALTALGRRYQLIVLSNVDRESFAASRRRLGVTFTSVITAQDVGSYKPAPANFEALLAEAGRLGIGEGKLLHVAQSLFHDHVPAQRIGLRSAWINRRHGRPGWGATVAPPPGITPDWEFPSMAALASAVAAEAGSA